MTLSRKWARVALLVAIYAALFWLGNVGGSWLVRTIGFGAGHDAIIARQGLIWLALLAYVVLLAIPFVPGMEISLALFAMLGSSIALPIYVATVVALTIAFLAGRMVPARYVAALFGNLGLHRAQQLVQTLELLNAEQRLATLMDHAPRRLVPFLIRHRYIAVAFAFNLPGNALIGGGGGIALLAGLSGLFSLSGYLIAVCIAILPVPLAVVLGGKLF
jgi:hypothetical protein